MAHMSHFRRSLWRQGKLPEAELERSNRLWQDNIKVNVQRTGYEGERCMELARYRVQWHVVLKLQDLLLES
jgi:hypothetical protein